MIKGCQKRVLWVKNIESDYFDGAVFIVSDKSREEAQSECSMVAEASRIISQSAITNYFGVENGAKETKKLRLSLMKLKWFTIGAALIGAISLFLRIF